MTFECIYIMQNIMITLDYTLTEITMGVWASDSFYG